MMNAPAAMLALPADDADLERRFGGLRRLYGEAGYARLRAARVAIVGLGGVGSWAAEALARSGVASLTLIDLDHVAESNINRQVQAVGATIGQAKAEALRARIADIHPGCEVRCVEELVDHSNWPALLPGPVDALIDACDQVRAKAVLAAWARAEGVVCVSVGAAGGKQRPQDVEVMDLGEVSHDRLLATLRQRLRQHHGGARKGAMGLSCVFSREAVKLPEACAVGEGGEASTVAGAAGEAGAPADAAGAQTAAVSVDANLNCHGYGSSVTVTATFGLVAAAEVTRRLLLQRGS
jgi:tRNA A37 threonylcarbamoyladenosine dehydratase